MVDSWLVVSTHLKKYEFVSWDDDIPNRWENKIHVPVTTNQIVMSIINLLSKPHPSPKTSIPHRRVKEGGAGIDPSSWVNAVSSKTLDGAGKTMD